MTAGVVDEPITTATLTESVRPGEGVVPTRIFVDERIHARELSRLFPRTWLFVGHESEVPASGDYVVRTMGKDSVVMVRSEDDQVRVLLNQCRHRGMQICRAELGNASHFRCPYHGWIYKNDGALAGVPLYRDVYGANLNVKDIALREPRTGSYRGFVFACWDDAVPSFDDFIGDFRWYLDLFAARTDAGLEVVGPPQRWVADMNWKLGADNFTGDGYHVWTLHRHAYEMGMFDPNAPRAGHVISTPEGHGIRIQHATEDSPMPEYFGMAPDLVQMMERNLDAGQREALRRCNIIHGNVFPNLSFAYSYGVGEPHEEIGSFVNIRLWQPTAADKCEVWSWFLVDREAPEAFKAASRRAYVRTHGVSGTFDQDDFEVWTNITATSSGPIASGSTFNYVIGLGEETDPDWPGPGTAFNADYSEANQRNFYSVWLDQMTSSASTNGAAA